ncbi:DUF2690 domain-containing protein [Streptomyces sp. ACA25]|uniref:DUF2690 domain-containing protein n=1 Tax=Streptomyces sp. ACA25 TaxID=3022596 RepID=UPI0023076238|nr:DUF2690 domain-containing protein [Streptomyces sp. ACA25]MDB1087085.1 DUF2690 domain-containing protein [Streptomyces sp. ACA25]
MTGRPPLEHVQFTERLGELRERTGLSLKSLAERTTASKSSWHRYLNGSALPPRELVLELCALAGEPPGRLLALWELAEAARSGRGGGPGAAPAGRELPAQAGQTGKRTARWRALPGQRWAWPAAAVLVVGAVLLAVSALSGAGAPGDDTAVTGCRGAECTGKDPESQGCTTAGSEFSTVTQHAFPAGARMEIRYSADCGASWTRVWLARIGDRIEIRSAAHGSQEAVIRDRYDAEGYVYTPMVAGGPETIEACLIPGVTGEPECFGI